MKVKIGEGKTVVGTNEDGTRCVHEAGAVIELSPEEAAEMVRDGIAVAVVEEKPKPMGPKLK